MDEHLALLEVAGDLRRHLAAGDRAACGSVVERLGDLLTRHVGREERGVFAALREQGDFVDAVEELEAEHVTFDAALVDLDVAAPDFDRRVLALLDELSGHVDKENLGVFPVAVVTLGARGWDTVGAAHEAEPSFLANPTST